MDPEQHFSISAEAAGVFTEAGVFWSSDIFADGQEAGAAIEAEWNAMLAKYRKAHGDLATELDRVLAGKLPSGWEKHLPTYKPGEEAKATRQYSQKVLEKVTSRPPSKPCHVFSPSS